MAECVLRSANCETFRRGTCSSWHNRFECLQQMEGEEPSVDDEWRQIEQGYVETCEKVLGQAKSNKKEWISKETWETIEQRKEQQDENSEERCE